jgi:acetyl esterase
MDPSRAAVAANAGGGVDAETAGLLRRLNEMLTAPAPSGLSELEAARARASRIFTSFAGPIEGEPTTQIDIAAEKTSCGVPMRVYRRTMRGASPPPIVIFFHGGGWSLGTLDDYDVILRTLAGLSGAIFASIDYRLAPEHPFPAGLDDAFAAVSSIVSGADSVDGDSKRIALMGDSAGGNLAAVIAQKAIGIAGLSIRAQFLLYPMLDLSRPHTAYPSRLEFGDGEFFLTRDAIEASLLGYLDDPSLADDPRVSPINASDLAALPATRIFVGGLDPLRDEAVAYARKLDAAGADVALREFPGAIHGFLSFGALESARRARRLLAADIANAFNDRQ